MTITILEESLLPNGFAMYWTKALGASKYNVLIDEAVTVTTNKLDATISTLSPDSTHHVRVEALNDNGDVVKRSTIRRVVIPAEFKEVCVTDFGAVSDGEHLNTATIQKAIDECAEAKATLVFPEGRWLTGALFLKSNTSIKLEKGAILFGSANPDDYPPFTYRYEGREQFNHASLLNTPPGDGRYHDIRIYGDGTIDANGKNLFLPEEHSTVAKRGSAICLRNVSRLLIQGVTVREAAFWCLHPVFCDHVTINSISLINRVDKDGNFYGLHNGDGIDIDSCKDVAILSSRVETQDDCIAIKSGQNDEGRDVGIPSERIWISSCEFYYGFGVAMGSETAGGVYDVYVQGCNYHNSYSIASLKNRRVRGGHIERITYEDCNLLNEYPEIREMVWFRGAIYIDQFYGIEDYDPMTPEPVTLQTPYIGKITMRNINLRTLYGKAIYICGLPEQHIDGVVLENVTVAGLTGMLARNVDGLELKNVSISCLEDGGEHKPTEHL